ncbi:MAG: hypothetical protein P1U86_11825 [Verrucomicrobiales bacterium]|nr:hypothetical protein [Verrucomicrobiales bacterium]
MLLFHAALEAQFFNDFDVAPHSYYERTGTDSFSELLTRKAKGDYDFGTETGHPLLRKLLEELNIPVSSQVLVYSQTSLQRKLVSPENPRAMYFDENIYLAVMAGGKLEVNSFDPEAGGIFYFEDPPEKPGDHVDFERPKSCLGCHGGSATNFLPGPLARSNFVSDTGRRMGGVRSHERISHWIPFRERWGGYYVTGAPSTLEHMGNAFATREAGEVTIDLKKRASLETLEGLFDPSLVLRGDSNIVPLMLFDHQIEAHNLLVEMRYRERISQFRAAENDGVIPSRTLVKTEAFADKLVKYLLFADEVSLEGHEITPSQDYLTDFRRNRKANAAGESLKDFDLKSRLFKNRLSYMIYSEAFEGAPQSMKDRIYSRLRAILSPAEPVEGYDYFDEGERARILSILTATKTDLPADWESAKDLAVAGR